MRKAQVLWDEWKVPFGALRVEVALSHTNGDANQAIEITVLGEWKVPIGALRVEVALSHTNGDANQAIEITVLEFIGEI